MKLVTIVMYASLSVIAIAGCQSAQYQNPYRGEVLGTWLIRPGLFGQPGEMYLAALDTSTRSLKLLRKETVGQNLQGAISLDGRQLLFNSWDQEQQSLNLYLKDMDTGNETRLSRDNGEDRDFSWFPDNEHFVYRFTSHADPGVGWLLFVRSSRTGDRRGIGCLATDHEQQYCDAPAVSSDGGQVAYAKGKLEDWYKRGMVVYDPPDKSQRRVIRPYSYKNALYVYNLRTQREEELYAPDGSKSVGRVVFTPDGKGLVMVLQWQDMWANYATDLVYLDLATRETKVLLASSDKHYANFYPVLTLDGRHLIFLSAPTVERELTFTDWHLYQLDVATGKEEPLLITKDATEVRLNDMKLVY